MMKFLKTACVFLLMLSACWAQGTSQIQGIVTDATGAAVPGAEVKATQTGTSAVRTATTGADGVYILTSLPIGPYRLEVSKQGLDRKSTRLNSSH